MCKISIILSFYGNFCSERARCAINSILRQNLHDIELVISESGLKPRLSGLKDTRISYIFSKCGYHNHNFRPGEVRNRAFSTASGEFIYTTDADIVILNPEFLSNLVELIGDSEDLVLRRPRMRRLVIDHVPRFLVWEKKQGLDLALSYLDYSQEFIAKGNHELIPCTVYSRVSDTDTYLKTFTAETKRLEDFGTTARKGSWPSVWWENLHCGGIFMRSSQFRNVGGYCERFQKWGCEDSDLQWKLQIKYRLHFIPYTEAYEVLHLDHEKPYFSRDSWLENENISSERRSLGINAAIEEDDQLFQMKYPSIKM